MLPLVYDTWKPPPVSEGLDSFLLMEIFIGIIILVICGAIAYGRLRRTRELKIIERQVLVICPYCSAKVEHGISFCPHCGGNL